MADAAPLIAGVALMLTGTVLIGLLVVLDFGAIPLSSPWFLRPLVLLPLALACLLGGTLVVR